MNLLWPFLEEGSQSPFGGNFLFLMLPLALIWIFLVIVPQRKDAKRRNEMQSSLKKGDRVLTQSGIVGKVAGTEGDTVLLEFGSVKIPFLRTTVVKVLDT